MLTEFVLHMWIMVGSLAAPDVAPDVVNGGSLGGSVAENLLQESCSSNEVEWLKKGQKEAVYIHNVHACMCTICMYMYI